MEAQASTATLHFFENRLEKKEDEIIDLKVKLELANKTISELTETIEDNQRDYKILSNKYKELVNAIQNCSKMCQGSKPVLTSLEKTE